MNNVCKNYLICILLRFHHIYTQNAIKDGSQVIDFVVVDII